MNPCIIERCKSGLHNRYYPMELVEIVTEEHQKETEKNKNVSMLSPIPSYSEYEGEYEFNHNLCMRSPNFVYY